MNAATPTHVIVDSVNSGPAWYWPVVLAGILAVVAGIGGAFLGAWYTGRHAAEIAGRAAEHAHAQDAKTRELEQKARDDERAYREKKDDERLRWTMTGSLVSASVKLSYALLNSDNQGKDIALAETITAFDLLRIQFEADNVCFMRMMREKRNTMADDWVAPLNSNEPPNSQISELKQFRDWLEPWLNERERIETELQQASTDNARNQERQRQVEAEVRSRI